jgi:hypothetical protein
MKLSKSSKALSLASIIAVSSSLVLPKLCEALTQPSSERPTALLVQGGKAESLITQPIAQLIVAINVPNLEQTVSLSNGVLQIRIPTAYLEGVVNETLRQNGGRVKETEFQKLDLSNMRSSFTEGGLVVDGNFRFQVRERIAKNPFTGRWTHSPWMSVSGTFTQPFNVSVNNKKLNIQATGRANIQGAGNKWYGAIRDDVARWFAGQGKATQEVNKKLSSVNGMNVAGLLSHYGSREAAMALGVAQNVVIRQINQSINLNAWITRGQLVLSVRLR